LHAQVTAHRAARTVRIGPNAVLAFEDESTVRQQVQEMLRVEQISEPALVQLEIDAFAALIPDGQNLKATLTLEYADATERRAKTEALVGIANHVWVRIEGRARVFATVDAAADRAAGGALALTHQLTFELGRSGVRELESGGHLTVGIDHDGYHATLLLHDAQCHLLLNDLHAA
jgi:hypothetical protein